MSCLCIELHRFEILNVFGVEEHVPDGCFLLVTTERVTGQDDSLQDNLEWIWREHDTGGDHVHPNWAAVSLRKSYYFAWLVYYRAVGCGDHVDVFPQEPHVLILVILTSCVQFHAESWFDNYSSESASELHRSFARNDLLVVHSSFEFEVHSGHFALVREHCRKDKPTELVLRNLLEGGVFINGKNNRQVSSVDWKSFVFDEFFLLLKFTLHVFKPEDF